MKYYKSNQITNQDLFLEYKETYLILQRALLRASMSEEMKLVGETYEKTKTDFLEATKTR